MDRLLERIHPPPSPPPMPTIVKGLVRGDEAGRWYRVDFPEPVKNAVVTASSNARITPFLTRGIPRVTRDDFNNGYYCDLIAAGARDRAKTLAPPIPLDLIWAWFCDSLVYAIFYAGWWAAGWVLNVLWDSFIQPQIDHVTDAVNERLKDLLTMWGIPYTEDEAIALTVPMLWNVSDTGFEFLSLGSMDVWFTAIGDPE